MLTKLKMTNIKLLVLLFTTLFFGTIFFIAYSGNSSFFRFLKYVPGGDKTGHVVSLFILSLSFSWFSSFKYMKIKGIKIYYGVLFIAFFITIEEFLQLLSPYRTFDLLDLSCNYLGISLAILGIKFYNKYFTKSG